MRVGRPVVHSYLGFIGMSASELLSDFVRSGGGGGYGGHTYSVCTVWATIGPGCSVVYGATRYRMHASDASSDRMAGTGSTCIYTDIEGGPRVRSE